MPLPSTDSPSRPLRSNSKRQSMTITRSMGKALSDVMNKEKKVAGTDSEATSSSGTTRATTTVTRGASKSSRLSLESHTSGTGSEKPKISTPKPIGKKVAPPSTSKANKGKMAPPPPPSASKSSPDAKSSSDKPAKPRSSLTLRGAFSSALHSKASSQPSSLPKYKGTKADTSANTGSLRKRPNDWDEGKSGVGGKAKESSK
ncbi:hypothetical protein M422DRAFT_250961, partial [Sphaerobolus stellatus SS14]